LRQDFRSFRTDRIVDAQIGERRYQERRQQLLKRWRTKMGITP
jgi:predicted DNA-binding transcriptional regulator YafY